MNTVLSPLRILLVQDHADTAKAFRLLLQRQGFDVMVAQSSAAALSLAGQMRFDVLLSDIKLPDGDGCELLIKLRGELGLDDLRAIALSGYSHHPVIERAILAGFDAYLLKPVEMAVLFDVLEQVRRCEPPRPPARRNFIKVLTSA
jgi:CheY-like chemotaxis protein